MYFTHYPLLFMIINVYFQQKHLKHYFMQVLEEILFFCKYILNLEGLEIYPKENKKKVEEFFNRPLYTAEYFMNRPQYTAEYLLNRCLYTVEYFLNRPVYRLVVSPT